MNFGVIEVADAKRTKTPGWAYVPDTGINPAVAALQPSNRKRARKQPNLSLSDLSARQEAKLRKELEILDRDSHRDANIAIPPKAGGGSSRASKHTPNVRRILTSQKTFANHLDDFVALQVLNEGSAAPSARAPPTPAAPPPSSRRPAPPASSKKAKNKDKDPEDTPMPDADEEPPPPEPTSTILRPYAPAAPPPAHPLDDSPLLATRLPPVPSDQELRALVAAPALTYAEARAGWSESERRYPVRVFCEVCGYWGRVKCLKCGTRVCALDCLDVHREECVTRYGL